MQLDKMDHTSFQRYTLFWSIATLRHTRFLPLPGSLWRISPNRIWAASLLRSLDFPCTSDQLVAEAATYTTHNIPKRRTSLLSGGFEPTVTKIEQPQTNALDRTVTPPGPAPFLVTYLLYILLCELRNARNAEACYIIVKWSSVDILKADEG